MTTFGAKRSARPRSVRRRVSVVALVSLLAAAGATHGQERTIDATSSAEETTARYFDSVRHDPLLALLFLREMPKGGDLHTHLSGAIYAESYIRWAIEDGLCVQTTNITFVRPPCDSTMRPPAARAQVDDALHDAIVDALSMRNWLPSHRSGHSHFFDAFDRFRLVANRARMGDMLAEVTLRAAREHVSYLELMATPEASSTSALAQRTGWNDNLDQLATRLLENGLRDIVAAARRSIDAGEARQREALGCGGAQAAAACNVVVRYLYQVARAGPPERVFAQVLTGFELAAADPRVVGFNFVQPEDHPIAMRDFTLHMRMIAALRAKYPGVRISLHAGELTTGLVPPEGLRSHIRESLDIGGAQRIGHGASIAHEEGADELLQRMARERILVEIALSSNDAILGIRGDTHPLTLYMRYGVPVALATDDAGVLRSDMTMEFLKATREHDVGYIALKAMARNSIRYGFVEEPVKARLLQELERAFAAFEQKHSAASNISRDGE